MCKNNFNCKSAYFFEINTARVKQRVSSGGDNVPTEKIISRYPNTHNNVAVAIDLSDSVYILDNSSYDKPFKRIAIKEQRRVPFYEKEKPDWIANLFS